MLQHLSGGGWGVVLRRIFEAAARTLPWMAIFFLPLVFGLRDLYPWTDTAMVAQDHLLKEKALYLNVPFFLARAGCFLSERLAFRRGRPGRTAWATPRSGPHANRAPSAWSSISRR
jgi:hypothetical protein